MRVVPKDDVMKELSENCNPKIILVITENGKNYIYDNEDLCNLPIKEIVEAIDSSDAIFLET